MEEAGSQALAFVRSRLNSRRRTESQAQLFFVGAERARKTKEFEILRSSV